MKDAKQNAKSVPKRKNLRLAEQADKMTEGMTVKKNLHTIAPQNSKR